MDGVEVQGVDKLQYEVYVRVVFRNQSVDEDLIAVDQVISYIQTTSAICLLIFFFNDTATTEIYTLSLHDALPIWIIHALQQRSPVEVYGLLERLRISPTDSGVELG